MRLNILIGGKAGQGINKISAIVSQTLISQGYFTFNYRDYPSIIRGGHNFNVLSFSENPIESHESKIDGIVAMDDITVERHKGELKSGGFIINHKDFEKFGMNLNIALSGALMKILGFDMETLLEKIKASKSTNNPKSLEAAKEGYNSQKTKYHLKKQKRNISIMTGSRGMAIGARNSKCDLYLGYPMTPSTGLLHEMASKESEEGYMVFQPENEIAVVNAAIGASYTGAKVMIGSSGGGFDLMTEGLSLQGVSEVPLVVHLAQRPGPGTGVPTYNSQGDLGIALRGGHGEFPRIVVAPGNPTECVELTNEAFYLSQKFGALSIVITDKHIVESEFSSNVQPKKPIPVKVTHPIPGTSGVVVKASSYEQDENGNTTENAKIVLKNQNERLARYEAIRKECHKFQMYKIHGKKNSKNLIVGWGSTRGAIIDSIKDGNLDAKFLQVLYMKPMSSNIRKELEKAKNIILVENNLTGQLGRLIREKTGIYIPKKNRILRYDARVFQPDTLIKQLQKVLI